MGQGFDFTQYIQSVTAVQQESLGFFRSIFLEWNQRINLISRKDTESFELKHVVHSLAIRRFIRFYDGARVLDLGTGGGFPGIPLAICNPDVKFTLVDSIEKKIKAVEDMVQQLGLKNVVVLITRAEELQQEFDYVVSRAVAPMPDLVRWTYRILVEGQQGSLPNGWLVLKGGDLKDELAPFGKNIEIQNISEWWQDDFFETKCLVYLPRQVL
jgi:16S rRNA (guanine527-N7)-methyltransferase